MPVCLFGFADAEGWHWAFNSYRDDTWSDMDYELGIEPLQWFLIHRLVVGNRESGPT